MGCKRKIKFRQSAWVSNVPKIFYSILIYSISILKPLTKIHHKSSFADFPLTWAEVLIKLWFTMICQYDTNCYLEVTHTYIKRYDSSVYLENSITFPHSEPKKQSPHVPKLILQIYFNIILPLMTMTSKNSLLFSTENQISKCVQL